MRAVVFDSFGQAPALRQVPDPTAPADGVVVQVEATGLCRSDWHGWAGHDPGIALPHVPGHEFVGRVVARGTHVRRVQVGDRIITPFVCGCGSCPQCASGNAQVCPNQTQPGFTHWGSYAERVVVRNADFNAITVAADLDPVGLVSLGCRFATSFRALHQRAQVRPGERVAVFGAGGVGLSAVMIAAALGAEVVAVDVSAAALDLARQAGAHHVVQVPAHRGAGSAPGTDAETDGSQAPTTSGSPQVEQPPEKVAGPTTQAPGAGDSPQEVAEQVRRFGPVHITVEALGNHHTAAAALWTLAPRGRHVQIGLFPTDPVLPIGRVIADEIAVLGSHGMAAADYQPMLDLIGAGRLRPADLVTRRLSLAEAPQALMAIADRPHPGMTVILPAAPAPEGAGSRGDGDGRTTARRPAEPGW